MVSDSLYKMLVEQARDYALFLLDREGRILSWNLGAQRLKGYAAEEIIGRHFSTFYTREAIESRWPEHELEVATAEGRFEDEGWRVRKDGSRFWANVVITALRDDHGQLLGFSTITRDVTDRKLHEEALRQSEERFRLLVEAVVDYAIFTLDAEGVVTSWNRGAERIKGERFWARAVVSAIYDDAGHLRGFAKITQDLTDQRHLQDLEKAARHVNEFIATLAHELRNPLAPIRAAVQIMAGLPPTDPAQASMREM